MIVALLSLLACQTDPGPPEQTIDEPGELMVGVSRVRMPVPLGIGTVGYGGFGVESEPSPFAEIYPATTRIHNHPDFRIVVISRGEGHEVVMVRSDTVGVFQQFRRAIVLEVEARLGRDMDDALLMAATHTHSGPGRVIDAEGAFELIADRFFPEFYENMVDAVADGIEAAFDDLQPGRVGHVLASAPDGISDRRCEDGDEDYVNGELPIIAVEQEGELSALVLSYAIHGTVMGIEDLNISQDVSGGIEQAVEDRFDHPVQVMMFNSWGADMAPGDPEVELQDGVEQPSGYDRMEEIGVTVADAVDSAIADVVWETEPELAMRTVRFPIGREEIGYEPGVFEYEWGGVYCGSAIEADCDPATTIDGIDAMCIPFSEEVSAPPQTEISAGRIGDLHFVTFPGEPGTELAEQIIDDVRVFAGVEDVMFVGYGQDYTGYSILEDDWWQGGYEAGGAIWGPKQGEYLAVQAVDAFARVFGFHGERPEPEPLEAFGSSDYDPFVAATPVDLGAVLQEVEAIYAPTDEVVFTVSGTDPWLGAPIATLETSDGDPVLRANGLQVDSDGQGFYVDLATDPTYAEDLDATTRAFHWIFHLPAQHKVPGALPSLSDGSYQIRVTLPTEPPTEVVSGAFSIEE